MEFEVRVEGRVARIVFRDGSASLADLPREVLRKLVSAGVERVIAVFPDRLVYVSPRELASLLPRGEGEEGGPGEEEGGGG